MIDGHVRAASRKRIHVAMKKATSAIWLIISLLALWPAANAARARQAEVSYEFFYAALQKSGTWMESTNYGYVWQPRVAVERPEWRPYSDGYWSNTDQGWTWVSFEEFGWAAFHYGRWARLAGTGWVWVPGFEWAPSWVAWRTTPRFCGRSVPAVAGSAASAVGVETDDVVGWAPLPPEASFNYSQGLSAQVDFAYQIGPGYYNFVPVRYFGELVLLPWIFRPSANEGFVAATWNCTNIIFRPNPGYIWSGGPSYWALRSVTKSPIAQLHLVSQSVDATSPACDFANQVEGDQFLVTAPIIIPPKGQSAASVGLLPTLAVSKPTLGASTIAAKSIDHGWSEPPMDSDRAVALRKQIKQQAAAMPALPAPPSGATPAANIIRITGPSPSAVVAKSAAKKRRAGMSSPGILKPSSRPPAGSAKAPNHPAVKEIPENQAPGTRRDLSKYF
jgi:hypothetical protein